MCKFCSFDEDGWAVSKEKKINLGVLGKTTLGLDFSKKPYTHHSVLMKYHLVVK